MGVHRTFAGLLISVPFLLLQASGALGNRTVNATVGGSVLLLCPCPATVEWLAWQTTKQQSVNHFDENVHNKQAHKQVSKQYMNRTQLFVHEDPGNCSVLISNITMDDGQTYECHYQVDGSLKDPKHITLRVLENNKPNVSLQLHSNCTSTPSPRVDHASDVAIGLPIIIIIIIIIIVLLVIGLFLRRRRKKEVRIDLGVAGEAAELETRQCLPSGTVG